MFGHSLAMNNGHMLIILEGYRHQQLVHILGRQMPDNIHRHGYILDLVISNEDEIFIKGVSTFSILSIP